MNILIATDAHVNEAAATTNYGSLGFLSLSNASSAHRYAFLYFPKPFPAGASILTATLNLRLKGSWSGSTTVTVKRVTAAWSESRVNYTNKPAVTTTHSASASVSGGADGDLLQINIASMLQDVASGSGTLYGLRVEISSTSVRGLYSTEAADADLRPSVDITWSEAPNDPDQLVPDDQKVSSGSPVLHWRFSDPAGNTAQASSRVQIATDSGFSSIVYDTTKTTNDEALWDLDEDGDWDPADLTDGTTLYWRVMVWDETDYASGWSDAASMTRDDLGSLSISNPGATVEDTTPTIAWSLTGETQTAYRVSLYRVETSGALTRLWFEHANGTTNQVTVPNGLIVSGKTFQVLVEVWDAEDRPFNEHLSELSSQFTYVRDGTPDPPATLVATPEPNSPAVTLTWTRSAAPDYWCLTVDGVEVDDRIDVGDTFVSGTTYELTYWGASPRDSHTYEIEAVVSTGGGPYLHSDGNPTDTATSTPVGIWLVDDEDGTAVQILGRDTASLAVREIATTYDVLGQRAPVRITDVIGGYTGSISGTVTSVADRDAFLELKERSKTLRLVIGDLSIPVQLEGVTASPTPNPGDAEFVISFDFFQSGAPWPVDNV